MRNVLLASLATLLSQISVLSSVAAQEQRIDNAPPLEAIRLERATLKMKAPDSFCRVDPVRDSGWYKLASGSLTGKLVGMWTLCEDLKRMRGGEILEPRKWIMAILQRTPDGAEGPMENITRAYALGSRLN